MREMESMQDVGNHEEDRLIREEPSWTDPDAMKLDQLQVSLGK